MCLRKCLLEVQKWPALPLIHPQVTLSIASFHPTAAWQLVHKNKNAGIPRENNVEHNCTVKPFRNASARASGIPGALSHVDASGQASMVDIAEKIPTTRVAKASGRVVLGKTPFDLVCLNRITKGDVFSVARVAGISAAKNTHNLVPLCHQLLLQNVDVRLELNSDLCAVDITAIATSIGQTGVEMEALSAVSVAGLTVYDMCKAASKQIKISDIILESKSGGKADYVRTAR